MTTKKATTSDAAGAAAPKPAAAATRVETQVGTTMLLSDIGVTEMPVAASAGGSKYPFDDLAVGGFFGVMNKSKSALAQVVSRANARYRTETDDGNGGKTVNQTRSFYSIPTPADIVEKLKGTPSEGAKVLVIRKS